MISLKKEKVISLNPNSDKEILSVGSLIKKVKNGKLYVDCGVVI